MFVFCDSFAALCAKRRLPGDTKRAENARPSEPSRVSRTNCVLIEERPGRQGTASLADNTILLSKLGSFLDD